MDQVINKQPGIEGAHPRCWLLVEGGSRVTRARGTRDRVEENDQGPGKGERASMCGPGCSRLSPANLMTATSGRPPWSPQYGEDAREMNKLEQDYRSKAAGQRVRPSHRRA